MIKCSFNACGCKKRMRLEEFDNHIDTCVYNTSRTCNNLDIRRSDASVSFDIVVVDTVSSGRKIPIKVRPNDTVQQLKKDLKMKENIPFEYTLVFGTEPMVNMDKRLIEYNIHNGCNLFVIARHDQG